MHPIRNSLASIAFAVLASVAALTAVSQEPPYQPQLNQPGKDVQWVPTPAALVEKMLDLATLKRDDLLVDLGSGDGVLVIAAARRGVRARGIEYDAKLVEYSKRAARDAGGCHPGPRHNRRNWPVVCNPGHRAIAQSRGNSSQRA